MRMVMFQKTTDGPGLPDEVENRGHILEGAQPVAPGVAGVFWWV